MRRWWNRIILPGGKVRWSDLIISVCVNWPIAVFCHLVLLVQGHPYWLSYFASVVIGISCAALILCWRLRWR